jgi:hypothetical protein
VYDPHGCTRFRRVVDFGGEWRSASVRTAIQPRSPSQAARMLAEIARSGKHESGLIQGRATSDEIE